MLVAQVENDTLTDMEELPRGDWWICPPPYRHTINQMFHFEMSIAWFSCMCAGPDKGSCACVVRATLALQLDCSVFWEPLRLPTRDS